MGYFTGTKPWIIAHRGLAITAVENTLKAFQDAIHAGATHLETDVQASSDGVAVLCHDPDLMRLAGRSMPIAELTFDELRSIDLGNGARITSLEEALGSLPHERFNIDIKDGRSAASVITAIRRTAAMNRVLVTSFSRRRRRLVADALDGVATSPAASEVIRIIAAARLARSKDLSRRCQGFEAIQIPERFGTFRLVTSTTVQAFHNAGLDVHVWTVDDLHDMKRLIDMGVDGIVTNRSDLLSRMIDGL